MAKVVDGNVHLLAADQEKYPLAPAGGTLPPWARGTHLTAEALLEHMDRAGVDQAMLVHSAVLYGYDNSYTADSAERYPERFVAVGAIDATAPGALDTLEYWVRERGMRGIRFEARGAESGGAWLETPQTVALLEAARRLRVPVGLPTVRMADLGVLRRVLERVPEVSVFLRRLADAPAEDAPPYAGAKGLFAMADLPQLYLTFSHHNIDDAKKGDSTPEAFFDTVIGHFGANRLLWASFFPVNQGPADAPYKGLLDRVRAELAFLDEEARGWLLGESARALFPTLRGLAG
jgi:predicted TIM-barrel fold metal-dependent hydrolase